MALGCTATSAALSIASTTTMERRYSRLTTTGGAGKSGCSNAILSRSLIIQRDSIERAIRETCELRKWLLRALNVRTNHVHVVLSSETNRPDRILNALKANATRQLRNDGAWSDAETPWAQGGSKRYVWTEVGLERVIDYVVNGQDGPLPKLD